MTGHRGTTVHGHRMPWVSQFSIDTPCSAFKTRCEDATRGRHGGGGSNTPLPWVGVAGEKVAVRSYEASLMCCAAGPR
jgi:hypothetical protein